jgi:hypothetical protein
MLIERLLFRHLAANDYREHDVQQLWLLSISQMQRCDVCLCPLTWCKSTERAPLRGVIAGLVKVEFAKT